MKDILIVAPTKTELPPIKGAVKTGFGKERTKNTIARIIKDSPPSIVISVGLVGAVIPELKVGDIVIPEEVMDYAEPNLRYKIGFPIMGKKGLLVTVPRVFEREDKIRLRQTIPDATCVDMETSAVAEVLEPLGIPLLCIKAVSDGLDFDFRNKRLLSENIRRAVSSYTEYLCKVLGQIS